MTPAIGRTGRLLLAAALIAAGVATTATAVATPAPRQPAVVGPSRPAETPPLPAPPDRPPTTEAADAAPNRIIVPSLDVDTGVLPLGLDDDGRLEVPATADVAGWWQGGTVPATPGPTVLVGHVDWDGRVGVFHRLDELGTGDLVEVVDSAGTRHRFTVERIEQHAKTAFPTEDVYGPTAEPTLRLITCGGDFDAGAGHYADNVIVFARLVGSEG